MEKIPHYINQREKYICPYCKEKFRYKANLNRHKCKDETKKEVQKSS